LKPSYVALKPISVSSSWSIAVILGNEKLESGPKNAETDEKDVLNAEKL